MGSQARFANHSCDPNCVLQKWSVNGEPRVVLVTIKPVSSGTELTYNYQYYQDGLDVVMHNLKRQKCCCGATFCCGTVGGRVNRDLHPRECWLETARVLITCAADSAPRGQRRVRSLKSMEEHVALAHNLDNSAAAARASSTRARRKRKSQAQGVEVACPLVETAEYAAVVQTISRCREWAAGIEKALTVNDVLLEESELRLMLSAAPVGVRVDSVCGRAESALKAVEKVTSSLRGFFIEEGGREKTKKRALEWSQVTKVVEAMIDALPLRCSVGERLLLAIKEYTVWVKNVLCILTVRRDTLTLKSGRILSPLWRNIERLASRYAVDVDIEAFFLTELLEARLNQYIHRRNMLEASSSMVNEHSYIEGTETSSLKDTAELHCFCCLPDDQGEYSEMVQCDKCLCWYHLQCANASSSAYTFRKKKRARLPRAQQIQFNCPLCQFQGNDANNFCNIDKFEWHRYVQRKQVSISTDDISSEMSLMVSMSYEALQEFFLVEETLELRQTPVSLLLRLVVRYVEEWKEKVRPLINFSNAENDNSIGCENSESCLSVAVLKSLLVAYVDLRMLCVCPQEVKSVRREIWKLCLKKSLLKRASLLELKKHINVGRKLGVCSKSEEMHTLSSRTQLATSVLQRARECCSLEDAIDICSAVDKLSIINIDVTHEYAHAKVKSIVVAGTALSSENRNEICNSGAEVYCWCRGGDDGYPMVECDSCGTWYHYDCVGIRTQKDIKALQTSSYICMGCTSIHGWTYAYEWPKKVGFAKKLDKPCESQTILDYVNCGSSSVQLNCSGVLQLSNSI